MGEEADKSAASDLFSRAMAEGYDERNRKLAPISDNMHFLVRLVLEGLPAQARVLCVGVGTGAEILSLAKAYPGWRFVGLDPSAAMLDVCRERLAAAGVLERCDLAQGYVDDVARGEGFDAVVSVLVAHFVPRADRAGFYEAMRERLKPGGMLVSSEICFDLASEEFPAMLENWKQVQGLMGATPESLAGLAEVLHDKLSVVSPDETRAMLRAAGFGAPVQFFQSFMIRGWYARR